MSNIDNLYDLSETITAVVNRALEIVTENTSSGQYYVSYDDVSDLISHEDYLQYFDFIVHELQGREEVLDLDTSDHELDIVCGLAWCKNYEPLSDDPYQIKGVDFGYEELRKQPSMARLAELGQNAAREIILRNGMATLTPASLGAEEEELAYIRSITGYDQRGHMQLFSSAPFSQDSYENLLLTDAQQREQRKYDKAADKPLAFDMCVNARGQMDEKILANYPQAKEAYEQLFSWDDPACDYRYGVLISGKPAIGLDYGLNLPVKEQEPDDSNFRHAVTAMVAAQLNEIFSDTTARITYGHSLGAKVGGDIVALLPAYADPKLVREFDHALARTLKFELPLSCDLKWAKKQYDAVVARVSEELPKNTVVGPWVQANPEFSVVAAFASLGSRLGAEHREWRQALATHDTAKQARIADTYDLTKLEYDGDGCDLLSTVVRDGIYKADSDLSNHLCLYTSTEAGKEQSFTAPKGQIISAMKEMGYQGEDIYPSIIGYSEEMAVEIKRLVEQMPRLSLFHQMVQAQKRKDQNAQSKEAQHKEKDHGQER